MHLLPVGGILHKEDISRLLGDQENAPGGLWEKSAFQTRVADLQGHIPVATTGIFPFFPKEDQDLLVPSSGNKVGATKLEVFAASP